MSAKHLVWGAIALGAIGGGIVATLLFRLGLARLRRIWNELWKGVH